MQYLLKEVDLKKEEIYVSSYPDQGEYIFVCEGLGKSGACINPDRGSFNITGSSIVQSNGFENFREATETEKKWLRWCIANKRFYTLDNMLELHREKEIVYSIY